MDPRNTGLSDWIKVYDDMLTEDFCQTYSKLFDRQENVSEKINSEWRRCKIYTQLDTNAYLYPSFKQTILQVLERYKRELDNDNLNHLKFIEAPNIIKYSPEAEEPNWFHFHSDNWSVSTASRQLSVIIYLNEVEEGGETCFPHIGVEVKPVKGRILIFPSFYLFAHLAKPPISHSKYVIVSWIHFGGTGHHFRVSNLFN